MIGVLAARNNLKGSQLKEKMFKCLGQGHKNKENRAYGIPRNETKRNETKRNEMKRNETKRNETKRNETK